MGCNWFIQLEDGREFCAFLPPDLGLAVAMTEVAFAPIRVKTILNMDVMLECR